MPNSVEDSHHSPSRLPADEYNAVQKDVEEWVEQGIVRKSFSNVASRVVVIKKKDGTLRLHIDYRKLNSMVLVDCFPVPNRMRYSGSCSGLSGSP